MSTRSFLLTPVGQAVHSMLFMAAFGVVIRFGLGAFDPDFRTWTYVQIAPLLGLFTYLRASGRVGVTAAVLFGLGVGGIGFWILAIIAGGMPITSRMDWVYVAFIFAIPVGAIVLAVRNWRQVRTAQLPAQRPSR